MTGPSLSERIAESGKAMAVTAHALWLSARDARTPLAARLLAVLVAAYALSPIDLIPDFIPVLGWIDDLIIVCGSNGQCTTVPAAPQTGEIDARRLQWREIIGED